MANDEVLGPRKTMLVLVIVVGCFAVLWPRLLSPLMLGRDPLKPNQFDRDAGCCEVLFDTEVAVLELLSEVCSSAIGSDGKLSLYAAAECRKSVNSTCGVDIAEFLKRDKNVRKSAQAFMETLQSSNSSCLQEHFGVPVWSLSKHTILNPWMQLSDLKQERPLMRGAGPHPALRERGRAIPPAAASKAPAPPSRGPTPRPPHARVRSPLSVYYEVEVQPPPIPGMRPPLGSPGGPVAAPKSSMSFVMPIYTICIIVFFVYTLSKILFKRTGSPYEAMVPDPHFRRRVFRDDSRSSPDTKLGDVELEQLRARLADTERAMQRIVSQLGRREADVQDELGRPYTNGTVLLNNAPVRIVTSEYKEDSPEKIHSFKELTPEHKQSIPKYKEPSPEPILESEETTPEPKEASPEPKAPTGKELTPEPKELSLERETSPQKDEDVKDSSPEPRETITEQEDIVMVPKETSPEVKEQSAEPSDSLLGLEELIPVPKDKTLEQDEGSNLELKEETPEPVDLIDHNDLESDEHKKVLDESLRKLKSSLGEELEKLTSELSNLTEETKKASDLAEATLDLIEDAKEEFKVVSTAELEEETPATTIEKKQSTPELLAEALKESPEKEEVSEEEYTEEEVEEEEEVEHEPEKSTVKVLGMTVSAHSVDGGTYPDPQRPIQPRPPPPHRQEPEEIPEIYLKGDIPQQGRVLVTDFDGTADTTKDRLSPLVVSGKMTLSLIQDSPRDTPERDPESTVDDFTTASAVTQPAAEKKEELSEEELEEEEDEVEEIEEEVEVEEIEEDDELESKPQTKET